MSKLLIVLLTIMPLAFASTSARADGDVGYVQVRTQTSSFSSKG